MMFPCCLLLAEDQVLWKLKNLKGCCFAPGVLVAQIPFQFVWSTFNFLFPSFLFPYFYRACLLLNYSCEFFHLYFLAVMASFSPLGISFEYLVKQSSAVGSYHCKSDLLAPVDLVNNFKLIKLGSYKCSSIVKNSNKKGERKAVLCLRAP